MWVALREQLHFVLLDEPLNEEKHVGRELPEVGENCWEEGWCLFSVSCFSLPVGHVQERSVGAAFSLGAVAERFGGLCCLGVWIGELGLGEMEGEAEGGRSVNTGSRVYSRNVYPSFIEIVADQLHVDPSARRLDVFLLRKQFEFLGYSVGFTWVVAGLGPMALHH